MKKRVVIAGLGDTGLLVALGLSRGHEVIGITPRPALVSGQEVGLRVSRPNDWRKSYLMAFSRYRALRDARVCQGLVERLELSQHQLVVRRADDTLETLSYDALILAPGVTNGFWRSAALETREQVERSIDETASALARASSIAVIGGGVTGVSAASNLKETHPSKRVVLVFGHELLPGYHPRVRAAAHERLVAQAVELKPGHRARVPDGFHGERLTHAPVEFSTGQPALETDVVLWATGAGEPNTGFVPPQLLDERGFLRVDPQLRVLGHENVFAVGDAAATDPNRSSARNGGAQLVAHNVRKLLQGRADELETYRPSPHRWGSIFGVQRDGLRVFAPGGSSFRISPFWVRNVVFPWIVARGIYSGIDAER